MPKMRKIKPRKWHICTEGVTEQYYLDGCIKALELQGRVNINCGGPKGKGCGRQHEALLDKFQNCYSHKFSSAEALWLLHDLDDGKTNCMKRQSFDSTFFRAWDESDARVIFFCPCFEYWLILHVQDYAVDASKDQCQKRFQEIYEKKRKEIGCPVGEKDDYKTDPNLFQLLGGLEGMEKAIERAKKQLPAVPEVSSKTYRTYKCSDHQPGTNLYVLLESLKKLSEENKDAT